MHRFVTLAPPLRGREADPWQGSFSCGGKPRQASSLTSLEPLATFLAERNTMERLYVVSSQEVAFLRGSSFAALVCHMNRIATLSAMQYNYLGPRAKNNISQTPTFLNQQPDSRSTMYHPSSYAHQQAVRSAIGNIPVEILAKIFLEVVTNHTPPEGASSVNAGYPPWLTLELVCKHWRDVVEQHPDFYALQPIPIHNSGWTETVIQRSRTRSLFLCIDDHQWSNDALQQVSVQPHRVDRLSIDVRRFPSEQRWISAVTPLVINKPYLNLREFKLAGHDAFQVVLYEDAFADGSISFPHAIDLTSAWMHGTHLTKLMHPELVKLSLANVWRVDSSTFNYKLWTNLREMANALNAMPKLQTLTLTDDILPYEGIPEGENPSLSIIHLPRLQALTLGGLTGEVLMAWKQFTIPASTDLSFEIIEGTLPEDTDVDTHSLTRSAKLVQAIFSPNRFSSRLVFDTLSIVETHFHAAPRTHSHYRTTANIRLTVARLPKEDELTGHPLGPKTVDYSVKYRGSSVFQVVQALFDALPPPIRAIRALTVTHPAFGTNHVPWLFIANTFLQVERVAVEGRSAICLLEVVLRNASAFPALKVLQIHTSNILAQDMVRWGDHPGQVFSVGDALVQVRAGRQNCIFQLVPGQPSHAQ
ncbi:hypothetical protein OF83DRAFT_592297 [Amylostereum chailletii]|nr:hypothetical protein OF83DRAFT_592297 [Amylostereum chailletii]